MSTKESFYVFSLSTLKVLKQVCCSFSCLGKCCEAVLKRSSRKGLVNFKDILFMIKIRLKALVVHRGWTSWSPSGTTTPWRETTPWGRSSWAATPQGTSWGTGPTCCPTRGGRSLSGTTCCRPSRSTPPWPWRRRYPSPANCPSDGRRTGNHFRRVRTRRLKSCLQIISQKLLWEGKWLHLIEFFVFYIIYFGIKVTFYFFNRALHSSSLDGSYHKKLIPSLKLIICIKMCYMIE